MSRLEPQFDSANGVITTNCVTLSSLSRKFNSFIAAEGRRHRKNWPLRRETKSITEQPWKLRSEWNLIRMKTFWLQISAEKCIHLVVVDICQEAEKLLIISAGLTNKPTNERRRPRRRTKKESCRFALWNLIVCVAAHKRFLFLEEIALALRNRKLKIESTLIWCRNRERARLFLIGSDTFIDSMGG